MSKGDLITISNNCKEAIRQCKHYYDVSIFNQMLILTPGTRATTMWDAGSGSAGQPSTSVKDLMYDVGRTLLDNALLLEVEGLKK